MSDWPSGHASLEAWESLAVSELSVAAAAVTFSGLPIRKFFRGYVHVIKDGTGATIDCRINNLATSLYANQKVEASATSVAGARDSGNNKWVWTVSNLGAAESAIMAFEISKNEADAGAHAFVRVGYDPGSFAIRAINHAGHWNNTADHISRIDVLPAAGNLAIGTRAALEGLAA